MRLHILIQSTFFFLKFVYGNHICHYNIKTDILIGEFINYKLLNCIWGSLIKLGDDYCKLMGSQ